MAKKKDYNWLDDPFKDKPDSTNSRMKTGSKLALGGGCFLIVVVFFIALFLLINSLSSFSLSV